MRCLRAILISLSLLGMSAAPVGPAGAESDNDGLDCYDVIVKARIIGQTPSVSPDCGDDCITMVWPWFLKLDVKRVVTGPASSGRMVVQTMQHTHFRDGLGSPRWWLRRNSANGFNLLRVSKNHDLPMCRSDAPPAEPYISPGPGQTLQDLLLEGERAYRARP
jgi:hypothetical protein